MGIKNCLLLKGTLVLLCLAAFCADVSLAETSVNGNITQDTTWTLENGPYIVIGTIQVFEGVTLTIEPGVTVKFNNGTMLRIGGELVASGTSAQMITFTSNKANPAPGDWGGISFLETAVGSILTEDGGYIRGSIIKHCRIEYSGPGITSGVGLWIGHSYIGFNGPSFTENYFSISVTGNPGYAHVSVLSNTLSHNGGGIYVYAFFGSAHIMGNTVSHNEYSGIIVSAPTAYVTGNTVNDNAACGIGLTAGGDDPTDNTLLIAENIVTNNATGIWLNSMVSSGLIVVKKNTVASNRENGLRIGNSMMSLFCEIFENNILNNGQFALNNEKGIGSPDVDATNNWWGTASVSEIAEMVYDYYDDITRGKVIFQPIAQSPFPTATTSPVALFSASPVSGDAPLTVAFTDQSVGSPTSWSWNFGDGGSSTIQNPTHTYATPGTYTVSLTVSNASGSNTVTKNNYIEVSSANGTPGSYQYYLPYFTTEEFYATWLGISNCSASNQANLSVTFYDEDGTPDGTETRTIPVDGQDAFPVAPTSGQTSGWMLIDSDQPLAGFCFYIAVGAGKNYVTTADLIYTRSTELLLPHISQNPTWDTTVLLSNPNSTATSANLTYVSRQGVASQSRTYTIPAMGSTGIELSEFMGSDVIDSGKVKITATQGICGFALYTLHSFYYNGISHVSVRVLDEPPEAQPVEQGFGNLSGLVTDARTGRGIGGATVTAIPGSYSAVTQVSSPFTDGGRYTINHIPVGTYTVTASKGGYSSGTQGHVAIAADQTVTVNISLNPSQ